jgi:hypothetical protein
MTICCTRLWTAGPAARLGKIVVEEHAAFRCGAALAAQAAPARFRAGSRGPAAMPRPGRVTEVDGWVVPESVALYSALAAQFA